MSIDLHDQPFDEGTRAKLLIYGDYIRSWLPVFLARKTISWKRVNVFDFFAGPGSDLTGFIGSPLIIIKELFPYIDLIREKRISVTIFLNEFVQSKYLLLSEKIKNIQAEHSLPYKINVDSLDFKDAFEKYYNYLASENSANLLLLDQSGVKHITPEIFQNIISFKTTDFLFFISSSTINRFSELPTIKKYVDLNRERVEATEYYKIHTLILEYYQNLIPKNRIYYLAPFSIKKGANIYGLIFGSGHILGMQKFLEACWKADPQRGEANFDIDRENLKPGQMGLFSGKEDQPKKVDIFENELQKGILEKRLVTDEDVYLFTIRNGFLPKHTRKITKALMDENKIKKVKLCLDSDIVKPETPKTVLEIIADGN